MCLSISFSGGLFSGESCQFQGGYIPDMDILDPMHCLAVWDILLVQCLEFVVDFSPH